MVDSTPYPPWYGSVFAKSSGVNPRAEVDPELCVAGGAAMQAAMLQGHGVETVLVDVTPYTFGTSAIGEVDGVPTPFMFVPMIRKNTPIPVSCTESFYTVMPGTGEGAGAGFPGREPAGYQEHRDR